MKTFDLDRATVRVGDGPAVPAHDLRTDEQLSAVYQVVLKLTEPRAAVLGALVAATPGEVRSAVAAADAVFDDLFGAQPPVAESGARCESCGITRGVGAESSHTAYPWDGTGPDPNRDQLLCRACAADHHAYWDEQWAAFRRSQL